MCKLKNVRHLKAGTRGFEHELEELRDIGIIFNQEDV
jgi:hypothetical protein